MIPAITVDAHVLRTSMERDPAGSTKAITHIYTAPFIAWLEEMLGHPARGKHILEEGHYAD